MERRVPGQSVGGTGVEDAIALGRLQNLLTLTTIATGTLALAELERPRKLRRFIRDAPIVDDPPPFVVYRLIYGVRSAIRALAQRTRRRLAEP